MSSGRTSEITVPPNFQFGEFANAFRIVEEVGPDCFLDFIVFSGQEQKATVVSRIRVRKAFLPSLRSSLEEALSEFSGDERAHFH